MVITSNVTNESGGWNEFCNWAHKLEEVCIKGWNMKKGSWVWSGDKLMGNGVGTIFTFQSPYLPWNKILIKGSQQIELTLESRWNMIMQQSIHYNQTRYFWIGQCPSSLWEILVKIQLSRIRNRCFKVSEGTHSNLSQSSDLHSIIQDRALWWSLH